MIAQKDKNVLAEIFIPASNKIELERFKSDAEGQCRPECNGVCDGIVLEDS